MKSLNVLTPWQKFKEKFKECKLCAYHTTRNNIVLAKGKIPCDVLFIGEAPGLSEDTLGLPFIGPAGKLLEQMIQEAITKIGEKANHLRICFTNMICCIPLEEGSKAKDPSEESIDACMPRLEEFIKLCKPRLIVGVGTVAGDSLTRGYQHSVKYDKSIKMIAIVHPSAILRKNDVTRWFIIDSIVDKLIEEFNTL